MREELHISKENLCHILMVFLVGKKFKVLSPVLPDLIRDNSETWCRWTEVQRWRVPLLHSMEKSKNKAVLDLAKSLRAAWKTGRIKK